MDTSRRGFFGFLAATPVIVPVVAQTAQVKSVEPLPVTIKEPLWDHSTDDDFVIITNEVFERALEDRLTRISKHMPEPDARILPTSPLIFERFAMQARKQGKKLRYLVSAYAYREHPLGGRYIVGGKTAQFMSDQILLLNTAETHVEVIKDKVTNLSGTFRYV